MKTITRKSVKQLINESRRCPGRRINLSEQDLSGLDLCGLDLRGAYLCGSDLRGAYLCGSDLRGADLQRADLRGADLQGANLRGADLWGASLRNADLCGSDLRGADLQSADLRGAELQSADLRGAELQRADLQRTSLQEADLQGANLDFTSYELSCRTIGIIANERLVSQLLYHLCTMDVQGCPEWDELRNDDRVIALANKSHVIDKHELPEIEPLKAQESEIPAIYRLPCTLTGLDAEVDNCDPPAIIVPVEADDPMSAGCVDRYLTTDGQLIDCSIDSEDFAQWFELEELEEFEVEE